MLREDTYIYIYTYDIGTVFWPLLNSIYVGVMSFWSTNNIDRSSSGGKPTNKDISKDDRILGLILGPLICGNSYQRPNSSGTVGAPIQQPMVCSQIFCTSKNPQT